MVFRQQTSAETPRLLPLFERVMNLGLKPHYTPLYNHPHPESITLPVAAFLGTGRLASSVFIATCCCLLPRTRPLTQPQAHRQALSGRSAICCLVPRTKNRSCLEKRWGEGRVRWSKVSSETPPEGQCFRRQEPPLELQVVSLGPRRGGPGIISHWFPWVAAALSADPHRQIKKHTENCRVQSTLSLLVFHRGRQDG